MTRLYVKGAPYDRLMAKVMFDPMAGCWIPPDFPLAGRDSTAGPPATACAPVPPTAASPDRRGTHLPRTSPTTNEWT